MSEKKSTPKKRARSERSPQRSSPPRSSPPPDSSPPRSSPPPDSSPPRSSPPPDSSPPRSSPPPDSSPPPVDTSALADAPMLTQAEAPLGTLSANAEMESVADEKPKSSRRKKDAETQVEPAMEKTDVVAGQPEPSQRTAAPMPQAALTEPSEAPIPAVLSAEPPLEVHPLRLPRGGFIAFRKSGGMNFSTREVVVYPDGRVAYDTRGVPQKEYNRLRRALNDAQIIHLRRLLDQTNFWRAEGGGTQNPDAYAYEISARLGQRSNELTLFDGSLPETLKPLVELLTKLLPE